MKTDMGLFISALMLLLYSYHANSECLMSSGTKCKPTDPDVYRNVTQIIKSRGFPVEEHDVVTEDGFILSMQRIPHGRNEKKTNVKKPVVFLQHGLLADSFCWVLNWNYSAIGFMLADNGFDVWLGNIRGNRYSRRHVKYTPLNPKFWDWSFEEMADKDIPAMINYALKVTGQDQVFYIGHSQGTLVGFLSFSTNPQIAKKIKLYIALAPIFHLNHTAKILRDAAFALGPIQEALFPLGPTSFLPGVLIKQLIMLGFCGGKYTEKACYHVVESIFGYDDQDMNMTRVPVILAHFPSGTSFKNIIHFGQVIYSGQTRRFDYGYFGNLRRYGKPKPPLYDVSKITIPVVMYLGQHDTLSVESDVAPIRAQIPDVEYYEMIPNWNHVDFIQGMDAPKILYPKIIKMLRSYA
ncbi:putative lysosomal acid lipase/cholesteryl ester hydrolase [Exaiptasia diaphana]|uniref:Lipase n=1 Tax=Exaiptasia diaphana TaxID=2652724 RepID=A0A913WTH3_EXADI|nr:putative lysosomal acid lipase/cholesteryl ester hydrolase [Exaiptasia diaphana]KXJ18069.1 putative lysosomal acid lipase/cholesteryl ester hydrolase [Exaiptasia diaphana]